MKKYSIIVLMLILISAGFFLVNEKQTGQDAQPKENQVAASFYPIYYFASEIAKDKADVFSVTPNGVEPHDFEPKPQDIIAIQKSKLLVVNGAGFEPWVDKLQQEFKANNVIVITTTEGLALKHGKEEPLDPHVWLSPVLAKGQVDNITKGFVQIDPQNKTFYEANANELKTRLDELNTKYKTGLQSCQVKTFVTSHAAFGYLASTYNLTQLPIAGLSPEAEPSTAQLAEVTNFVKQNNTKYIFFETLVSPALSETIATETGAQTLVLDPIEGISDDKRAQGKNYFTVMEANLQNLQTALECSK